MDTEGEAESYVCEDCGTPGVAGYCQLCNGQMIQIADAEEATSGYGELMLDDESEEEPSHASKAAEDDDL